MAQASWIGLSSVVHGILIRVLFQGSRFGRVSQGQASWFQFLIVVPGVVIRVFRSARRDSLRFNKASWLARVAQASRLGFLIAVPEIVDRVCECPRRRDLSL